MIERHGRAMASAATVITVGGPAHAADVGLTRLGALEAHWSRFVDTSDLTRLNTTVGEVPVDASTIRLITAMTAGYRATGGRYDPTVLPLLMDLGYRASIIDPTRRTRLGAGPHLAEITDLVVDETRHTITCPPGTAIDPGGIGKGLAADLVVDELVALGVDGALVAVGGDLAVTGEAPTTDGWVIALEHPDPGRPALGSVVVEAGGVATSSTRSRRWTVDGVERHHALDPRTQRMSATDLQCVTVVAEHAWLAEVHATAALLEGRDGAIDYLAGVGVDGVALDDDGGLHTTAGLAFLTAQA